MADDPGSNGGQVLHGAQCDLLILPFERNLPNPAHIAFEAESLAQFEQLLGRATQLQLEPRSEPERNAKAGAGKFQRGGHEFLNFYVFDPSGTNIEIMVFV